MALRRACDLQDIYKPRAARPKKLKDNSDGTEKRKITVSVIGCKNLSKSLMRKIIRKYHWEEVEDTKCHLMWADGSGARQYFSKIEDYLCINQLPDMMKHVAKASLDRLLAQASAMYPGQYDFFPHSWDMAANARQFKSEFVPGETYIFKPSNGRQGDGIKLAQTMDDVNKIMASNSKLLYVAQQYIDKPLCLDGYKFDLRIYCMIESLHPLKVHVFRDGLARLCTTKYEMPSRANLDKSYMHLTNYSLNKDSESFQDVDAADGVNETEDNQGSKRSIDLALKQVAAQQLRDTGAKTLDVELFWKRVEEICAKTCLCIWPAMWGSFCRVFPGAHHWTINPKRDNTNMPGGQCYHILGFDILIDANYKPWLLEVNAAPSFGTGSVVDLKVKHSVIERSLDIAGILKTRDSKMHSKKVERWATKTGKKHAVSQSPKGEYNEVAPPPPPDFDLEEEDEDEQDKEEDKDDDDKSEFGTLLGAYGKQRKDSMKKAKERRRDKKSRTLDEFSSGSSKRSKSTKRSERPKSASGRRRKDQHNTIDMGKRSKDDSKQGKLTASALARRRGSLDASSRPRTAGSAMAASNATSELSSDDETEVSVSETVARSRHELGVSYLRQLREQKESKVVKDLLAPEAYESVNFVQLDYTSLRPTYEYPDCHLFGHIAFQKVYGQYTGNNYAVGLNSAKMVRLLQAHNLMGKTLTRVDVDLQFMKMLKLDFRQVMSFGLFCEFLLWVSSKLWPKKSVHKAAKMMAEIFIQNFEANEREEMAEANKNDSLRK